jgi:hypothetical protein
MGTHDGIGKGMGKAQEQGKVKGKRNVKGKVLLNILQGEMISLVPLLCCCRRRYIWHTVTWRAN